MGRYYALHDGEDGEVATAIEDHYRPRFAGDELPRHPVGGAGRRSPTSWRRWSACSRIGQLPTGDKDPFALRRHALGVLRILGERLPALSLDQAVDAALTAPAWPAAASAATAAAGDAAASIRARCWRSSPTGSRRSLAERGYAAAEIDAVLADDKFGSSPRSSARLVAVRAVRRRCPRPPALAAANKRVGNILKKAPSRGRGDGRRGAAARARRSAPSTPRCARSGRVADAALRRRRLRRLAARRWRRCARRSTPSSTR